MPRHLALVASFAILLAGCGGGSEAPTEPAVTGLRIVTGASISDTVLARPVQALIVEVHRSSGPAAGLVVRFESLPADSTRWFDFGIAVSNTSLDTFGRFASDTTNSSGRAGALVQLGTVAGEARIVVSCPELGLSDTAKFTVLPGRADRVVLQTADTVLFAGASYTINAYAADRFGNRRNDVVSFAAGENVASVDPSGRVAAGTTVGHGSVALRVGSALDSARFTVVPAGTMAFVDYNPADQTAFIATAKLDGSNKKRLIAVTTPAYPNISPTGNLVAYQQTSSSGGTIYVVDANGATQRLTDPADMSWGLYPHFSGDGAWVYFAGLGVGDAAPSVWRIHPDGTALTRVAPVNNPYGLVNFGVAPDGSHIASTDGYELAILTLATGARLWLGSNGAFPEFSPESKRLAFVGGSDITIINVDASGQPIRVAPYRVDTNAGLAWTPDGKWLLVRGLAGPILVNTTTGNIVPLPFGNYYQFSVGS